MNIETIREYCLSLPLVTEDFPFDETTLVFRVLGKIFACLVLVFRKCRGKAPEQGENPVFTRQLDFWRA